MAENIGAPAEVTGLFDDDALLKRRVELHHELGRISSLVCQANQEYSACIESILITNSELQSRGIDKARIQQELWPARHDDELSEDIAG